MPEETKEYTVDEGDYFDFDLNANNEQERGSVTEEVDEELWK